MILSDAQVDDFSQRGFVVLESFFDRDTMAQVSTWLDDLRDREPAPGQEAKYYERSPLSGETILVRVENLMGDHSRIMIDRLLSPDLVAGLTRLLGEPPVLFKEKVNYKLPGCRADKLHQDQAAGWNRYCDFFVTVAIAVDPNREDNAALSIMSSGNYRRELMTPEWQPLTDRDPPYEPRDEYRLLEADPGDIVIFDSYVPHGSPANSSRRSRRNIFLTFNRQSTGSLRSRYYADKLASYAPNQAAGARAQETFRV